MKRLVPTRSIATMVMAFSLGVAVTVAVLIPVAGLRPATFGYVAMLVTGLGILLRERIFTPASR